MSREKKRDVVKPVLVIILVILLLVAGFTYYQYKKITSVRNLEVDLVKAELEEISLTGLTVGFTIDVFNPNSIGVNVGNLRARIFANNVSLAVVELPSFDLKAKGSLQHHFSVRLNYLDLGSALVSAIKEWNLSWRIEGVYELRLPFGFVYPYRFVIQG